MRKIPKPKKEIRFKLNADQNIALPETTKKRYQLPKGDPTTRYKEKIPARR